MCQRVRPNQCRADFCVHFARERKPEGIAFRRSTADARQPSATVNVTWGGNAGFRKPGVAGDHGPHLIATMHIGATIALKYGGSIKLRRKYCFEVGGSPLPATIGAHRFTASRRPATNTAAASNG